MNVIDFHVTKILSEKYGKVYELYGMTLEKAQSHPKSLWREYLLSDGTAGVRVLGLRRNSYRKACQHTCRCLLSRLCWSALKDFIV